MRTWKCGHEPDQGVDVNNAEIEGFTHALSSQTTDLTATKGSLPLMRNPDTSWETLVYWASEKPHILTVRRSWDTLLP